MSYKVTSQRQATMLAAIGAEAASLIDNKAFLPFYRSIQKKLEKMGRADEWANMVETAKTKEHPSRYFATICRMVKDGTYKFVAKVKEVASATALYLQDKLVKFGFGKYQAYWVRKAEEYINLNSQASFVELLEYVDRRKLSQKYIASALKNGKSPRDHYRENILGAA